MSSDKHRRDLTIADEITASAALKIARSTHEVELKKLGISFDQSGTGYTEITQTIGTSEEALDKGDVTTPGWCLAINLDATNFISLRPATGAANTIRLDANYGMALFKWGSGATSPYAIADTASCRILMLLAEA